MIYAHGTYIHDLEGVNHVSEITRTKLIQLLKLYGDQEALKDCEPLDPDDHSIMLNKAWIALRVLSDNYIECVYNQDGSYRIKTVPKVSIIELAKREQEDHPKGTTRLIKWCKENNLIEEVK